MTGKAEKCCLVGGIAEIGEELVAAVAGVGHGVEHAAKPRKRRFIGIDVGGPTKGFHAVALGPGE